MPRKPKTASKSAYQKAATGRVSSGTKKRGGRKK